MIDRALFVRIHVLPKKCKMKFGPISTWDIKSRYYYYHSLVRYLMKPEQQKLHQSLKQTFLKGEFGVFENVRFIETSL